jgi:hypothetical protein
LQIFTQSNSSSNSQTDLKNLSHQFWKDTTLKELLATQTPITANPANIQELQVLLMNPNLLATKLGERSLFGNVGVR